MSVLLHILSDDGPIEEPTKVVVVTLRRKLIVMANALIESDRLWVANRPCT